MLDDMFGLKAGYLYATTVNSSVPLRFGHQIFMKPNARLKGETGPFYFGGLRVLPHDVATRAGSAPTLVINQTGVHNIEFGNINVSEGCTMPSEEVFTIVQMTFAAWAL